MKKEIRVADTEKNIVRITTIDARWYAKAGSDDVTGLPVFKALPSVTWIVSVYPKLGLEQTLSAHPRISAGDELPTINELTAIIPRMLNSPLAYPEAFADLWLGDQTEGLNNLRDYYLQRARELGAVRKGAGWFTDKMPLNETHLGLIGNAMGELKDSLGLESVPCEGRTHLSKVNGLGTDQSRFHGFSTPTCPPPFG